MFKIGDFSKFSNTSVRMLRHYDEIGLLHPAETDSFTGYRYYSAKQLDTINKITSLKALGFSLAIIREIFLNHGDIASVEHYLKERKAELEEDKEKIDTQLSLLQNITTIYEKKDDIMLYSVTAKTIEARTVASSRGHIPSYSDEGTLWGPLYAELQKQSVAFSATPLSMSIFHDAEYVEVDPDVEVQVSIEGNYSSTNAVTFYQAPALKVASCTFRGSYDQMPEVTAAIGAWIESNDYNIAGPMLNIYHVSPAQDSNPENWVTEACFVIAKK